MNFHQLYQSVFAILRVEGGNARVAGTGFLIRKNPFYILTCNHVVGEGTNQNNGNVQYCITKRVDTGEVFDLRQGEIAYLRAREIQFRSDLDLAILKIEAEESQEIFDRLELEQSAVLELDFNPELRVPGKAVEWLSTGAIGELTLTPRLFQGNLIMRYISNQSYTFLNNQGQNITQQMNGITMLEVDKLFVPGCSGSPILDKEENKVIGFVHGYRTWPISTNQEISHNATITENQVARVAQLQYLPALIASLSLGIDIISVEAFLRDNHYLPENEA